MIIREYLPVRKREDLKHLKSAYIRLVNNPDNLKFLSYTGLPFEEKKVDHFFSMHESQGVKYLGASLETEEIIGILIIHADQIAGFEIFALVVDHHHRRTGTGKILIRHGFDMAREQGYGAVDVAVFADNKAMLALLIEMDFIPVRMIHHMRYDGIDLVQMKHYL